MRRVLGLLVAASSLVGGNALAYDVQVHNCASETLTVKTYNENDGLLKIPFAQYSIAGRSNATTSCNGTTLCKLELYYGDGMRLIRSEGRTSFVKNGGSIGPYMVASCS